MAEAEAPPAVEEPTPFPEDIIFREPMLLFLELLEEDPPDEEALIAAMLGMRDLHDYDRQWVEWPFSLGDVKRTPYKRGCFKTLCGILRFVEHDGGRLQGVAIDLLQKFLTEGPTLTRLPVGLVVEMGAIGTLCSLARRTSDHVVMEILLHVITDAPSTSWPSLIKAGVITAAVDALSVEDITPLEQLAALDVLLAIVKRSPARAIEAGAYEAVLEIDNPGLVPRRTKVLNMLRPMVRGEGEEDGQRLPKTNITVAGVRN